MGGGEQEEEEGGGELCILMSVCQCQLAMQMCVSACVHQLGCQ